MFPVTSRRELGQESISHIRPNWQVVIAKDDDGLNYVAQSEHSNCIQEDPTSFIDRLVDDHYMTRSANVACTIQAQDYLCHIYIHDSVGVG